MELVLNETRRNLLAELNLPEDHESVALDLVTQTDHRFLKDLKINVSNFLNVKGLSKKEAYLVALSVAINEKNDTLINSFQELATKEGASENEIADIYSCVSLLNINNVFYRFRHFTKKDYYSQTPANIKMSIMMNPIVGKEFFELVSLVISALNGCEMCVNAHEESLLKLGSSEGRIYDAVRLGAVIKGLTLVVR